MWTVLRFHPRTLQFRISVTLACLSALCSLLLRRRSLNRVPFCVPSTLLGPELSGDLQFAEREEVQSLGRVRSKSGVGLQCTNSFKGPQARATGCPEVEVQKRFQLL